MKALTQIEIDALLLQASPQLKIMVNLGFRHGMRSGEIVALKRADIDLVARSITIRRLKHSVTSSQPLGEQEYVSLAEWIANHASDAYVFPGTHNGHMDVSTYFRWFQKAAALAGIPKEKRHPHTCRHALGTMLAEANVTLPVIQAALGHRSPSSTFIYARPSADVVNRTMLKILDNRG